MNDEELDKLFKEQLEHHPVPPRKDNWHQIESQLDQEKAVPVRRLGWVSYAAIAIGCLSLVALLYKIITQPTPALDVPIIAHKEISSPPTSTVQESSKSIQTEIPVAKHAEQLKEQEVAKTETFALEVSAPEQKNDVNELLPRVEENRLELVELKPADLSLPLTAGLHIDYKAPQEYTISIPPIAPLIDSPETEESMLASTRKPAEGIVPGILNRISDALNPTDNATFQFSKDEEGFLRLDIVNSLVKNRNKKRR